MRRQTQGAPTQETDERTTPPLRRTLGITGLVTAALLAAPSAVASQGPTPATASAPAATNPNRISVRAWNDVADFSRGTWENVWTGPNGALVIDSNRGKRVRYTDPFGDGPPSPTSRAAGPHRS